MTDKLTLRTPADVASAVPKVLGFHPTNSLVVVGTPGPSARVDLCGSTLIAEGLVPLLPHLTSVAVVLYCDAGTFEQYAKDLPAILPGIDLQIVLRVEDGRVFTLDDSTGAAYGDAPTGTELDAVDVAESRDDMADRMTEGVETVSDAECYAYAAYEAGRGATAWVLFDHARDLNGGAITPTMLTLADMLLRAVPPTGH